MGSDASARTNGMVAVAELFRQMAEGLETGRFGRRPRVGLTVLGSEHGPEEMVTGAELAARAYGDVDIVLVGPVSCEDARSRGLDAVWAEDVATQHARMEELLDSGELDACVTMHYTFPIGVSTVGRVVTPGRGREMFIATTTGTSGTDRVENMVKNAVYGIAAAKACGVSRPSVGILNVDGARQVERALRKLDGNGYAVRFAESARADGGAVMRGNDLLMGVPDVMVCDTLTGNLLMKVFSSYTTGGDYEASGYGYGPGVGEGYERIIMILSRASGAPVVAGAIRYAADLVRGDLRRVAATEFAAARSAGWSSLSEALGQQVQRADGGADPGAGIVPPAAKVVTHEIPGVDILQLEDAVRALWAAGIYAESGMGCTGPIVMVAQEDTDAAVGLLGKRGYL
ncbi:MAG TPA: glycine/sarcosine/betaine reductase complex component C subunit alpha [Bacillota bacterium]|nr:glycine/sarcosine/betaine reductase complex component C subunit alpha [Bacillota bacterium]